MQLMPLDLPAPVAPAISRCGVVARSRKTALPGDVLADRDLERVGGLGRLGRREQVAERDELALVVRHLDADRRATRDRRQDADVDGRHRVGDVLLQARDPGDLHAGPELELVAGDRRTDGHAEQRGLDAVRRERLLQHHAPRLRPPCGRWPARRAGRGTSSAAGPRRRRAFRQDSPGRADFPSTSSASTPDAASVHPRCRRRDRHLRQRSRTGRHRRRASTLPQRRRRAVAPLGRLAVAAQRRDVADAGLGRPPERSDRPRRGIRRCAGRTYVSRSG